MPRGPATAANPEKAVAGGVTALAVSPDGALVAAACILLDKPSDANAHGWEVRVWDRATGKLVGWARGERWELSPLAFSPDGKRLAGTAWGDDKGVNGYLANVFVWDAPGLKQRHALDVRGYGFNALALARAGKADVLLAWSSGRLVRWDADTGTLLDDRQVDARGNAAAFKPDGTALVSTMYRTDMRGSEGRDRRASIDVATAQVRATVQAHAKGADRVVFASDGKAVATVSSSGRDTIVFDAATLAKRARVPTAGPAVFSPDGKTLCVGGTAYYDAATGRHRFTLGRHAVQVWAVAWSPDGRTLATSDNGRLVWLGDPAAGVWTSLIALDENAWTVRAVGYTPDGKTLAAGEGKLVKLFDPADGKPKATLTGHTSGVNRAGRQPGRPVPGVGQWDGPVGDGRADAGPRRGDRLGPGDQQAASHAQGPPGGDVRGRVHPRRQDPGHRRRPPHRAGRPRRGRGDERGGPAVGREDRQADGRVPVRRAALGDHPRL